MDYYSKLNDIIKNKKWFINDMGFGRIQFIKLGLLNETLNVFIICNDNKDIMYNKIEDMVVANEQIVIYYNLKEMKVLHSDEYELFRNIFTKDEWKGIFTKEPSIMLERLGLIEGKKPVISQLYKNIDNIIDIDHKASKDICEKFKLV